MLMAPVRPVLAALKLNEPACVGIRFEKVAKPFAAATEVVLAPAIVPPPLMVTVAVLLVGLPNWSWIWTVTAGLIALPAVVVVGCWTKANLLAAVAVTLKLLLIAAVSAPSVAFNVNPVPAAVGTRLEKVATPFTAAMEVVDEPEKAPPELIAIVTVEVFAVTRLLSASSICTVTADVIAEPAAVFEGPVPNTSCVAAPAVTLKLPLVAPVSPLLLAVSV